MENKTYETNSEKRNWKDGKLAKIVRKIAVGAAVVGALTLGGCEEDKYCFDFDGYIDGERIYAREYGFSGEKYKLEVWRPNEAVEYSDYNDDFVVDEVATRNKTGVREILNFFEFPKWQRSEYKAGNTKDKEVMERKQEEFKRYLKKIVYNRFALNPNGSRRCEGKLMQK